MRALRQRCVSVLRCVLDIVQQLSATGRISPKQAPNLTYEIFMLVTSVIRNLLC
jgi:hypothetical protein